MRAFSRAFGDHRWKRVVGVTAARLRKQVPALASERLAIGIELFASFFIPFYFFKAGLSFRSEYFSYPDWVIDPFIWFEASQEFECETGTATARTTWGGIKGLYR